MNNKSFESRLFAKNILHPLNYNVLIWAQHSLNTQNICLKGKAN
jgi:hypothetical protein